METVLVKVYSYNELSEEAQIKAKNDWIKNGWQNSKQGKDLINFGIKFKKRLECNNIIVYLPEGDGRIDYIVDDLLLPYPFSGLLFSDRHLFRAGERSTIKKALEIYYKIILYPRTYVSSTKIRTSKIIQNRIRNPIVTNFCTVLIELIKNYPKAFDLATYFDLTIKRIMEHYLYERKVIIDSFVKIAKEENYRFFADGSRYYNDGEF